MLNGNIIIYKCLEKSNLMDTSKKKRYALALLGNILFSFGLCIFGEAVIAKSQDTNWFYVGTASLIFINAGIGLMIKNKWGEF